MGGDGGALKWLLRACEESDPSLTGSISIHQFSKLLRATQLEHHVVRRLLESAPTRPGGDVLYRTLLQDVRSHLPVHGNYPCVSSVLFSQVCSDLRSNTQR